MTETETTERETLVRNFEADITPGDGRTVDLRIVPYNVAAIVADPPDFRPYRESFLPGAFERQTGAPDRLRVWLNFEHEQGLRGIVGHGVELVDGPGDLRGSFRVHENADGDKALQMVRDGLLPGVSMEFHSLRSKIVGGVTQRLRAHIQKVSLCRSPAYPGAEVLAVREEPELADVVEAIVSPAPLDPELSERLARLGVEPLQRVAKTSRPWDGSPDRFDDEQFERSALLCTPGEGPVKERYLLPVLEPDGTLNTNALASAALALVGLRGVGELKAPAARKLVRYYGQAELAPPASLVGLARS